MNLFILNPNTSESFTRTIQEAVDQYKADSTVVEVVNPTTGPKTVDSIYEELLSAPPSLDLILSREPEFDGFIIACYGNDLLVEATKTITRKPVVGITEASFYTACLLGHKFSVVTTGDRSKSSLWDSVRFHGLEARCASIRPTSIETRELEASGEEVMRGRLLVEARKALEKDNADVICLGCAGLAGFDKYLESELDVPVIDGVVASLKMMEALVGYGVGTSKRLAYAALERIELKNLPEIFSKAYEIK